MPPQKAAAERTGNEKQIPYSRIRTRKRAPRCDPGQGQPHAEQTIRLRAIATNYLHVEPPGRTPERAKKPAQPRDIQIRPRASATIHSNTPTASNATCTRSTRITVVPGSFIATAGGTGRSGVWALPVPPG